MIDNGSAMNPVAAYLALTLAVLLLAWRLEHRSPVDSPKPRERRPHSGPGPKRPRRAAKTNKPKPVPVIVRDPEQLAKAALESIQAVMAITDVVATTDSERSTYRAEVQDSVIAIVSAIIMADGVVHAGECKFVRTLIKDVESDDRAQAIVVLHAERWKGLSQTTPAYFQAIANFDRGHQTPHSRRVLTELSNIVRWTGQADGNYLDTEFAAASSHLAQLEAVLKKATWVVQWDQADQQQRIGFDRMYRRDEFGAKEII